MGSAMKNNYRIIYVFEIADEAHRGLLKIGEATVKTDKPLEQLTPNCAEVIKAAKKRISGYTRTAGISYNLLHVEVAVYLKNGKIEGFRDHDVHKVLMGSGISRKYPNKQTGREWFETSLDTAKAAISAVKDGRGNLTGEEVDKKHDIIILRKEQNKAIEATEEWFQDSDTDNRMLWNAKMRFGKTIAALMFVKRNEFKRVLIITHRPVVDAGWYNDYKKVFADKKYLYGSRDKGNSIAEMEAVEDKDGFIYFASIQGLRGSDRVSESSVSKHYDVFDTDWDLVIIDEAHEGTTTELGESVIENVICAGKNKARSKDAKALFLSGTPFNISKDFSNRAVYTWDYAMEQRAKAHWDKANKGDVNPYRDIPGMKMFTYDIGEIINAEKFSRSDGKTFSFKEFFRVEEDKTAFGETKYVAVHEDDIFNFLTVISENNEVSNYPFSTAELRDELGHTLWVVPGVKEAKGLVRVLKNHPNFSPNKTEGGYEIVNVAGDGDNGSLTKNALERVSNAIERAEKNNKGTITITCGKLTVGTTVPQWSGVLFLSGSSSMSAANYFQTGFRVQSPHVTETGRKEFGYILDFAPDRALRAIDEVMTASETASSKKKDGFADIELRSEFLDYFPVIAIRGTRMVRYDVSKLMGEVNRARAERAVATGFSDGGIYNLRSFGSGEIDQEDLDDFYQLYHGNKKSVKSTLKGNKIIINNQGFKDTKTSGGDNNGTPTEGPDEDGTPKAKAKSKKLGVVEVIRYGLGVIAAKIPLMVYALLGEIDGELTLERLVSEVDDKSWSELMPDGASKDVFKRFIKYYDRDVFDSAVRRIDGLINEASDMGYVDRINHLANILGTFISPDRETVLTPWRVVNMHMGRCLGGYNFFAEGYNDRLQDPRFIDRGDITTQALGADAKVLELNAKTGLYSVQAAYSIFMAKCAKHKKSELTEELEEKLMNETLRDNVFVICSTPMAKAIARKTLLGFNSGEVNVEYVDGLGDILKKESSLGVKKVKKDKEVTDSQERMTKKLLSPNFWGKEGVEDMHFDTVVGNPPYQKMSEGSSISATPMYQYFVEAVKEINPTYASIIMPARWYAGGIGLSSFRKSMLEDSHIREIHDHPSSKDIFPSALIMGGVCYFLWDKNYDNLKSNVRVVTNDRHGVVMDVSRPMRSNEADIFVRDSMGAMVIEKVLGKKRGDLIDHISPQKPFGLRPNFTEDSRFHDSKEGLKDPVKCYALRGRTGYIERDDVPVRKEWIDRWKVLIPKANSVGTDFANDNVNSIVAGPGEMCTETYMCVGVEMKMGKSEAVALVKYFKTKFLRYLHGLAKSSHNAPAGTYVFVPNQDFGADSEIDWSLSIEDIDEQLFSKYGLSEEESSHIKKVIADM